MQLIPLPDRTFWDLTLTLLAQMPGCERGHCGDYSICELETAISRIVGLVSSVREQDVFLKKYLADHPRGGIVLIGASPYLSEGGWLRMLLEAREINPWRVVVVGISAYTPQELQMLRELGIRFYTMEHIATEGLRSVVFGIMESIRRYPEVFVSLDLSCLDRSCYSRGSVGGFSIRELLLIVEKLTLLRALRYVALVSSEQDAKLLAKLICECCFALPDGEADQEMVL